MARRTKGEGTLRKRKDGRWEGWFNIGKDENGKTKRKSVTAKTKSECQEKLNNPKISGFNHRFKAIGHDPYLGLVFGTANIMTRAAYTQPLPRLQ